MPLDLSHRVLFAFAGLPRTLSQRQLRGDYLVFEEEFERLFNRHFHSLHVFAEVALLLGSHAEFLFDPHQLPKDGRTLGEEAE